MLVIFLLFQKKIFTIAHDPFFLAEEKIRLIYERDFQKWDCCQYFQTRLFFPENYEQIVATVYLYLFHHALSVVNQVTKRNLYLLNCLRYYKIDVCYKDLS